MSNRGWLNLESAGSVVPDSHFFEGDSAFSFLKLSKTTRLYGFIACLAIGFIFSLLGSIVLFVGQLTIFAILFVFGTVISLVGTGFLIGFFRQLKLMFKPVRVLATIVFIASIVLVFISAFVLNSDVLCLVFVLLEYLAYTWYTLSYIPYARTAVLKVVGMA